MLHLENNISENKSFISLKTAAPFNLHICQAQLFMIEHF